MDMAEGDTGARWQRYLVTRGHPLTAAVSLPVPTAAHVVSFQNTDQWQRRGDSHLVARGHNTGTQHGDTAMLQLLVASAHIPAAAGAGPGVHVSARFRGTGGQGDITVAVPMRWVGVGHPRGMGWHRSSSQDGMASSILV